MRQTLDRRLRQLEKIRIREIAVSRGGAEDREGPDRYMLFLRLRGIEIEANESVAMASARALEIDYGELRRQLEAGIDPIHKWFTDHGIFEEIARRKAAGTWPAAEGSNAAVRL